MTFITSLFIQLPITTQKAIRGHTSITDIGIALILGFAGGLALVAVIPEILVGVAIAVALVPPATVTGIGLALLNINLFFWSLCTNLCKPYRTAVGLHIDAKGKGSFTKELLSEGCCPITHYLLYSHPDFIVDNPWFDNYTGTSLI
jgi:hypothetical protein